MLFCLGAFCATLLMIFGMTHLRLHSAQPSTHTTRTSKLHLWGRQRYRSHVSTFLRVDAYTIAWTNVVLPNISTRLRSESDMISWTQMTPTKHHPQEPRKYFWKHYPSKKTWQWLHVWGTWWTQLEFRNVYNSLGFIKCWFVTWMENFRIIDCP